MTMRRAVLLAVAALAAAVLTSVAVAESVRPFDMTPEIGAMPAPPAAALPATAAPAGPAAAPPAAPAEDLIQHAPAAASQQPVLQPMPPVLDLRPAAPAELIPISPEQHAADDLPIDRFIVPAKSLRLEGEMDRRAWSIALTADEASRAARLIVTYANAVLVMPEGSRLSVSINGQRVVDEPIAAAAKPGRIAAAIPRGTLRAGANLFSFQVVQRHRTDCSVESTYQLWTEIEGAKTGLRFDGGAPHGQLGLDDLPAIGFDGDGTTHLRLVVPQGAENSAGSDLIGLVQAITLRGLYPHPVVTLAASPTAKPEAGTLDIVVAAAPELTTLVADAPKDAEGRPTAGFLSPRGAGVPILAISGPTWADVATAITLIGERVDRPVDVPRTVIDTASWLAPSPPLIVGERTLTLSDLDVPTEEFNGRRLHATFHVALPADFYANAYGEARIYLDAAFTDAVRPGSHIDVTVNGFLAANLPLTTPSGDILKRLPIKVSLAHFKPGVNELTIEAVLDTATDVTCAPGASAGGPPRFVLFDTTSFSMPDFARLGRWPNLGAFTGTGFPYSRNVDRTAVVLGRSDRDTYAAAATLLARLALAAGRVIAVDTSVSAETVGARNAIFVGAIGQFSPVTLASLGLADNVKDTWTQRPNYTPAGGGMPTIDPTGIRAHDAGDGLEGSTRDIYRRWNEHLVNPSGLRGQWAAFQDWLHRTFDFSLSSLRLFSTSEPPYDPPRRATIAVGQVSGPSAGQNWTYVLSPTSSGLDSGVSEITNVANWDQIRGRVAAFDAGTETFDVIDASSVEFMATGSLSFENLRLIAANWLSVNISTYAILLVMLCIVLGVCTSALLARLGRRA
jgi:hypothetical protein